MEESIKRNGWHGLVSEFLAKIPNPNTSCAYRQDLQKFSQFLVAVDHDFISWLCLPPRTGQTIVQAFAENLAQQGEQSSTIKRRLVVISALTRHAVDRQQGTWTFRCAEVKLPQSVPRAQKPSLDLEQICQQINRESLAGKRDYALVCLLLEGNWRREELCRLNCADVPRLQTQFSAHTHRALMDWLDDRGGVDGVSPLFTAVGQRWGKRLTGAGIYHILQKLCRQAGSDGAVSFTGFRNRQLRHISDPDQDSDQELDRKLDKKTSSSLVTALSPVDPHQDLLTSLLADRRSPNTRRAYQKDLQYFFAHTYQQSPTPQLVEAFLTLDRFQAIALVLQYKAHMIGQGLKEATVNRRLSALKSLVSFANKLGHCQWSLTEIVGERLQSYRDTTGIPPGGIKAMLQVIDRQTTRGKRDYAILRLLWDNALRRQEISGLNRQDYDSEGRSLRILGKGKGTQQTTISLSLPTQQAIELWLQELAKLGLDQSHPPLFVALDPSHRGHRLTGTAIYEIVRQCARSAGISKPMSPHRLRHSAITAALDATNGNVRKVQKLSRHKKLDTLMIYDDNRTNLQGEVSSLLSDLI